VGWVLVIHVCDVPALEARMMKTLRKKICPTSLQQQVPFNKNELVMTGDTEIWKKKYL